MKVIFGGGAALGAALLTGTLLFNTTSLSAGTISNTQDDSRIKESVTSPQVAPTPITNQKAEAELRNVPSPEVVTSASENSGPAPLANVAANSTAVAATAEHYTATAYAFRGRTASGRLVGKGIIAADPRVLPMGTKVRIDAGNWTGEYTVADTGGAIKGRKIDVWVPTTREACQFGRRKVKLTVLSYGGKRSKKSANISTNTSAKTTN